MMTNASPFFDTPSLRDAIANIKTEIPSESPLLTPVSSSSRRRKGNPRKCAQTTIGTSIESPACSSSSSNTSTDSGFSSAIAFNSFLASFSAASTSEVNQIQAVLQDLEQASALSMLTTNAPTGLSSAVSSAPNTPLILNDFTSALTKKPRVKASRRVSEDPASVTLPEGFEAILEKARSDGSTTATPHGLPPYAYTPRSDSGDGLILGLKRKRDNRSDTKITLQGPDGNIIEEHYEAEELQSFVKQFKVLRNKYGFTQGDVGAALGRRYGADFSQTTISRFEALNLSYKNMCKLRPLLEEWLEEVEQALEAGTPMTELLSRSFGANTFATTAGSSESIGSNGITDDQCSISPNNRISPVVSAPSVAKLGVTKIMPPLKKRRKRTNLDASQKLALDEFFLRNPRPDFAQITEIGTNLKLDNDVVRVWFCNRRQKMRRIDPVKSESPPLP